MAGVAGAVVLAAIGCSLAFTRVVAARIRDQARRASAQQDPEALPEQ